MFGFGPDMIYAIPGLLIALTVHEYAHAKVVDNLEISLLVWMAD